MNSDSIEGFNFSSSADNLCFRARLKEAEAGATRESFHPKLSGSSITYITKSFSSVSNYLCWGFRRFKIARQNYFG